MSAFKPILAPNDQPILSVISYPILASFKLDGIRGVYLDGKIVSRSLKLIPNKQIQEKFKIVADYCKKVGYTLDGEFYSPEVTFQHITHLVMTQDLDGIGETLPDHLKFYAFDCISGTPEEAFEERLDRVKQVCRQFPQLLKLVTHKLCHSVSEVESHFEKALEFGVEGLILRDPRGRYKYGRGTLNEAIIFKMKPFVTFDSKIVDVVQSTEVREGAEKKVNELGRSVTSKKKDDRILIEKASAFWVTYEGKPLKVTLAMTDIEKEEVWKNRCNLIGRIIEYKGMLIGSKDLPRHPVMLRFVDPRTKDD